MLKVIAVLFCLRFTAEAVETVQGFFDTTKDGVRFNSIFSEGLSAQDIASIDYAVRGLQYMKQPIPNNKEVCQNVINLSKGLSTVEQAYHAVMTHSTLQCKEFPSSQAINIAKKVLIDTKASLTDIMYGIYVLKTLGSKDYDKNALTKLIQDQLKKDDSVSNLGSTFHICAEIGCDNWAVERFEDALIQADEIDGKMMNWEGGLPVTSLVLTGIVRLSQATKKPSQITEDQSIKFANYLLSRRSVQSAKGAFILLEAVTLLANEKEISPVCITLKSSSQIEPGSEPITVAFTDLLGRQHHLVKSDNVQLESATNLQEDVVILSKQRLTQHQKDASLFILDLMKVKPDRGLYKLSLSVGSKTASVHVRVLGIIEVSSVEVGVGDVDGASSPRLTAVTYPNRIAQSFEADALQKVIVKFIVREKGQTQIARIHQTFVRIFDKTSNIEVIFVAEIDSSKSYRMEVDVGSVADKFNHESGTYGIELIIGDASISNPMRWVLADASLKFMPPPPREAKVYEITRNIKPEITHIFREPDARPPRIVSDIFTGLCIAPMFLLLVLWFKIGINVRNFPFSLSAIGFHLGFGCILGLFVVFWLKLTMFETIRYLLALGLITFICGHRLLRSIAVKRKKA